ncbi:hypothetical protein LJC59_03190 [Desulfovibrio sp. OttesenSCG-928-A18]|nr:hypothetical protein [Desulfovibrio sp. OttesenSCG-928-A18]
MQFWILILLSLAELVLFILLLRFFVRLKKSETLLVQLSEGQQNLMDKLRSNAELERELMQSFAVRQSELQHLNTGLEARAAELQELLDQAEAVSRSPQFLRELIITGKKKGRSSAQLAKSTGLSVDEVELILAQSAR